MEAPLSPVDGGPHPTPLKVVKRARIVDQEGSPRAAVKSSDGKIPVSPPFAESFRDKVAGFWSAEDSGSYSILSDESDVEEDDDDPRCPTIRIPAEDKIRVRSKFLSVVIISTLGKNFPFAFMSKKIPQLWARQGKVEIFDVGWGYYVVRFETLADQDRACFGGPWMVGDHYIVMQNWRPYFRPEDSSFSTLRVWIRLPGLPLEYFDASVLTTIGNKIGKTIRIDYTTLQGNRGNFARICVEVDLAKPLVSKYRLRRRVRRVEYEGLHVICFSCGCYGHQQENCPSTKGQEEEAMVTNSFENPIFQKEKEEDERPEVLEEFGPWMLVKRANRRGRAVEKSSSPPAGVKILATVVENGNRFGALVGDAEKETTDLEVPADFDAKGGHTSSDSAHLEKENVDPIPRKSNGKKSTNNGSTNNGTKEFVNTASSAREVSSKGPSVSKKARGQACRG
ncbi:hypothetical protein LINPERPRIM_LOCUS19256 [Linum perenne]